jgi:hypothetical protein
VTSLVTSIVSWSKGYSSYGLGSNIKNGLLDWIKSALSTSSNNSSTSTTDTRPSIKGANNTTQYGHAFPLVIGLSRYYPMWCGTGYTEISGEDGEDQYYNVLWMLGYGDLAVGAMKFGEIDLASNGFTEKYINGKYTLDIGDYVENGTIPIDGAEKYQGNTSLEIQSGATEVSLYSQRVVQEDFDSIELINADGDALVSEKFSAYNPQKIQVEIYFASLYSYNDNGDMQDATVNVKLEISFDGGKSWIPFNSSGFANCSSYDSSTGISTFTRAKNKNMRFVAERTLTYSEGTTCTNKVAHIRIQRTNAEATDSKTSDKVYMSAFRTWVFDRTKTLAAGSFVVQRPVIETKRDITVRLGMRIKATSSIKDELDSFNCMLEAKCRTWDSSTSSWSTTKTPTDNPAANIINTSESPMLKTNKLTDNNWDMEKLGELYEYCKEKGFTCGGVLTSQKKLVDVIDTILGTCRSYRILNGNKYSVFIDKPIDIPTTTLNNHNILKSGNSNEKEFPKEIDGYKIKFINKNNGYDEDEMYVMYDGKNADDPDAVIESVDFTWQTDPDQVYKNGRFEQAKRKLRPETWIRHVAQDGNIIEVGSLVPIQGDMILVGIGNGGEIKEIYESGGYITGFRTDGYINIGDTSKTYGVKINHSDGVNAPVISVYRLSITSAGYYNQFTFASPILATDKTAPCVGDIGSFGIYGNETIDTVCFGKKEIGDGTFTLTFIPYDEDIYKADSGTIPDFDSKVTSVQPVAGVQEIPAEYATKSDIASSVAKLTNGTETIASSDVPSNIVATAGISGITMSCGAFGSGLKNTIAEIYWQIKKGNSASWIDIGTSPDLSFTYNFDRASDGYLEASVLAIWQIRAKAENIYGAVSDYSNPVYTSVDTYGTWTTAKPIVLMVAEENGLVITWTYSAPSNFYGNVKFIPILKYNGIQRTMADAYGRSAEYTFDRTLDKYPEKHANVKTGDTDLSLYTLVIRAQNTASGGYKDSTAISPDVSSYLSWHVSAPVIQASVVGRNITLILSQNADVYGTIKYRTQIKKLSATADTAYHKPDLSTDPYSAVLSYKIANNTGYVETSGTFSQTVPLNGQNDTDPAPVATSYSYSVAAANEAGAGSSSTVVVTALAAGATDIVNESVSESKLTNEAVTARTIAAFDLAATKAYISKIAGNKGADANNYWNGLDGITPEFRIGNNVSLETDENDDAEYFHYIPIAETTGLKRAAGLYMKIKNFIVSAVASIVLGLFRVKKKGAADSASFMTVNPTDSADSITGTPVQTVNIKGDVRALSYYTNGKLLPRYFILDLSTLSASNFYPITFGAGDFSVLNCEIHSPSTGGAATYNQNVIHFQLIAAGWSDTPKRFDVLQYGVYDSNEITIGCIGYGNKNGERCVWLRGGMVYCLYCNAEPTLHTAAYSYGSSSTEVYTVGTDYFGGTNTNVTIIWTPDTSFTGYHYGSHKITNNLTVIGGITGNLTGNADTATSADKVKFITDSQFDDDATGDPGLKAVYNNSLIDTKSDPMIAVRRTDGYGGAFIFDYSNDKLYFYTLKPSFSSTNSRMIHQILVDNTMPVGAVYIQMKGQIDPAALFGGTWSNVSSLYSGAFFRAEGGNASTFGSEQQDMMLQSHSHTIGANNISLRLSGLTNNGIRIMQREGDGNAVWSTDSVGSTETRPINYTIRIWKRTA